MWGAGTALRETLNTPRSSSEQSEREEHLSALRETLRETAFTTANLSDTLSTSLSSDEASVLIWSAFLK